MNPLALSDSLAATTAPPHECRKCGGVSRIARGLCLGCLLCAGAEADEKLATEEFERTLDSIPLPDANWRIGNYEILQEIGRGGMGVIYRARQRHSKRIVALKRVLGYHADSRETLARFRREAEAAASLDHPNILPIYEVGESEEGVPFFSMKFASGGSLQDVAPALRRDPREIVRLMAKVTRAVQFAHRQGLLHRDLKPGNILLDGRGEPMVSDFGLAKWLDGSNDLTRTLTVFGTPGYIAPEQADGRASAITPTADVYSLGAILFDLLAGRPPFLGEHAIAVIRQAADKPAPKLRSLIKGANKDLETICAKCLEREPIARYRSAGDLAEDLERWLEGRPIIARPVSTPIRIWRWSRRNAAVSASLSACFALAVITVIWQIKNRSLDEKVRARALEMHSVAIMPFLDLDTTLPDASSARSFAAVLQQEMSREGPSRVTFAAGDPLAPLNFLTSDDARKVSAATHARTVLSGTTRSAGADKRITYRLLSGGTADLLASDSFVEKSGDQFRVAAARNPGRSIYSLLDRDDFSEIIAGVTDPGIRDERTHELLRSGRDLSFRQTLPDYDRAIFCFERAIQLAPGSAVAHAYLSSSLATESFYTNDAAELDRAEAEARKAVGINPSCVEARHALTGLMYRRGRADLTVDEALNTMEAAGPDETMSATIAESYQKLGRPDRSLKWYEIARHMDSRSGTFYSMVGDAWCLLTQDEKAEASYEQASEVHPDQPHGWVGICRMHLLRGEFGKARDVYSAHHVAQEDHIYTRGIGAQLEFFTRNFPEAEKRYQELAKADPNGGGEFYGDISYDSALACLALVRGDKAAATPLLEKSAAREIAAAKDPHAEGEVFYRWAAIDAMRGNTAEALNHLKDAAQRGWIDYRSLKVDPRFDSLRSERDLAALELAVRAKIAGMVPR